MRLNLVNKQPAPARPWSCELVSFIPEAVPAVLYGLWIKSQEYFWETPADATRARQMLAEVGSNVLMPCGTDIVNAVDRLYMLWDYALYRTVRYNENEGIPGAPLNIQPPIPDYPDQHPGLGGGLEENLFAARSYLDNWVNGFTTPYTDDTRNPRQQYDDILAKLDELLGVGFDDTDILTRLDYIALLLGV